MLLGIQLLVGNSWRQVGCYYWDDTNDAQCKFAV